DTGWVLAVVARRDQSIHGLVADGRSGCPGRCSVAGVTLMPIAGILRRWVLVSAVTGVLALIQVPGVRAQAVQPVQMPPNPNPNQPVPMTPSPNQPVPMAPSPGPLNSPANGDTGAPGMAPGMAPEMAPGTPPQVPLHS